MTDNLTAQELGLMVTILDIGIAKGIFVGPDLSTIGAIYNRVTDLADKASKVPAVINVDARGKNDEAEVRRAVVEGVEAALVQRKPKPKA